MYIEIITTYGFPKYITSDFKIIKVCSNLLVYTLTGFHTDNLYNVLSRILGLHIAHSSFTNNRVNWFQYHFNH